MELEEGLKKTMQLAKNKLEIYKHGIPEEPIDNCCGKGTKINTNCKVCLAEAMIGGISLFDAPSCHKEPK